MIVTAGASVLGDDYCVESTHANTVEGRHHAGCSDLAAGGFRITAVDQPNTSMPFMAVIGPISRLRSTGTTSPYPSVVWCINETYGGSSSESLRSLLRIRWRWSQETDGHR